MNDAHFDTSRAAQALHEKLADDPAAFAVVVVGPSGVGKTTLCLEVLKREPHLRRLVTTTTRSPRTGETNGVERHFLSESEFRDRLAAGAFVEYAEVHGHLYGATLDAVYDAFSDGGTLLMDVDVQGAETWRSVLDQRCMTVFVLPPSISALKSRLAKRQTETADNFQLRMDNAIGELRYASQCDYLIVNDQLSDAVADLCAIVRAERSRTPRRGDCLTHLDITSDSALSPS